jgi:Bifunctional DNA primase/polymerase, N-terminal
MSADIVRSAENLVHSCGYAIFFCRDDKKPFPGSNGFKDAVSDPVDVAALHRRYPGTLIGIATGAVSGVSVLDVDRKHPAAVIWWRENYPRLLPTRTYATRNGGLHLYFRHRDGVRNSEGRICQGVDTRGDGGYAIAWFAHGQHCWDQSPPAPWPAWLYDELTKPRAANANDYRQIAPRQSHSDATVETIIKRALDGVRNAAEGQKHIRLRNAALLLGGIMDQAGFSEGEAVQWLLDALPRTVVDWNNAERTARWGLQAGGATPVNASGRSH